MRDSGQHPRAPRFGPFEADLSAGELYRGGRKVRLQEKPFQVLEMLLERPGQVVTRQELQDRLWPADTFVDFDHNLNVAVKKVRDALGDSADSPRFVQTVARRGYRFIAPINDEGQSDRPLRIRLQSRRARMALVLSAAAAICIAVGCIAWNHFRSPLEPNAGRVMLAVLPFENFTGDPEQEYFSDGMTEEMITELGRLHPERLGVIARTSSMHYKNTEKRADQIGKELVVDYVLEGSVRRDSERVRITAQLIQVNDETHLWAGSYERHQGEVLVLQREVARAIAKEIEIQLTPEQEVRLARQHTVAPLAHEYYLKGLYFWNQQTQDGLTKSEDYFRQALAEDPSYALPYAGLAAAYAFMGHLDLLPRHEAYKKAKMAAVKAVELDDTASLAHSEIGFLALYYENDWARAESAFQRAIALNPNDPLPRQGDAYVHVVRGQFEQALAQIERARELDPLSVMINTDIGFVLYAAREYDRAIDQLQKTLAWDSSLNLTHWFLSHVYAAKGMYREALHEEFAGRRLTGVTSDLDELVQRAYEESGWRGSWQKRLEYMLKAQSEGDYVAAIRMVEIYIRLDDMDHALAWLEKAVQEPHHRMAFLGVDPRYDPLRSDPRFQDVLRRMNLPILPSLAHPGEP